MQIIDFRRFRTRLFYRGIYSMEFRLNSFNLQILLRCIFVFGISKSWSEYFRRKLEVNGIQVCYVARIKE